LFAYREPYVFQSLIDRLVAGSIDYLAAQVNAGAEVVQIFDSWAGVLPADEFFHWCVAPIKAIVAGLKARAPQVKVIAFPRGGGSHLAHFAAATGADALGLDTATDLDWVRRNIAPTTPLQGNLDPLALVAGGESLRKGIARITGTLAGRPYIFNLGHGILPQTPLAHVEALLAQLRAPA
ncbi:MAG TPA: uroporphyrinogen decarboxylase family protein, partial [Methylovirgula sp.]